MDNVSHTLVGAALGQAGLKKLSGLGMATLMIAANIPDVDVLAIPLGENLTFRRGWTHGPIGIAVLPVVLAAAMLMFDRWQARRGTRPPGRMTVRFLPLVLLAYIGALSHPFLDWLNSYGIRFLMPFSHEWYYGDALFIVDPWLWIMLGLGIALSRRRDRATHRRPEWPAMVALSLLAVYITTMIVGSRVAESMVRTEAASHGIEDIESMMAGPVPINPFRREIIISDGESYHTGDLDLLTGSRLQMDAEVYPINRDLPDVRRVLGYPEIQRFLYWSRFPHFTVAADSALTEVVVKDLRFSRHRRGGWASVSVVLRDAPLN